MMVMVMMMTQNLWKLIPQVAMVGSVLAWPFCQALVVTFSFFPF
jgi:hypothetical protein